MAHVLTQPDLLDGGVRSGRWTVVIYDNDITPIDTVIHILMLATECDLHEAKIEVWEAETYGHAYVHFADQETCAKVAAIIESVGVRTEVRPEWSD